MLGYMISCKKDTTKNDLQLEKIEFPTTAKELRQVQINKDIAEILEYVYQDARAYYEVNAAIYSEYYDDETVLIYDLLFPEKSQLYKREEFKKLKSPEGVFKKRFFEALAAGEYPVLKEAMGLKKASTQLSGIERGIKKWETLAAASPADTAIEIYSNSSGASIYFPYSENFGSVFTSTYFDNINTNPRGKTATIVAADREADSGPGREPYICGTRDVMKLCYNNVTVNDDYAEINPTHIIGGGADVMCHVGCTPPGQPPTPGVQRVYIGYVRLNMGGSQPDNFISLSKMNGGGAEISIGKASGYLKYENEQVTGFEDKITPDKKFKRKEIRKGKWRALHSMWEPDWIPADKELILGVWEEDNTGEQTFTGSLTTTVKVPVAGGTIEALRGLSYNIKIKSKEPIIRTIKMDHTSYFQAAKFNQGGCGFKMTDWKGTYYDTYELPTGYNWPIYDCNVAFSWTWPFHTY
jgi:hypothetical protein